MANVKFDLDADEAKAVAAFFKLVDAQKKAEDGMKNYGKQSRKTGQEHEQVMQGMITTVGKYIAAYVSIGGAIAGIRKSSALWHEDQEKMLETTMKVLDAYRDLQYLGENFRNPQLREQALQEAQRFGIKDVTEVMKGKYLLESMTGGQTPEQRMGLWQEMLEMRPTTSLTMPQMVPLFAKTAEIARGQNLTPNEIQNVIKYTMDQAAATAGQMETTWPRALSAAELGKVDVRTMGAMFATATGLGASPEQAVTSLEAITRGLMFPGEKVEGKTGMLGQGKQGLAAAWKSAGITGEENIYERMQKLGAAYRAGEVSDEELQKLVGEAGIRLLPQMLKNMEGLGARIGEFQTATGAGVDITRTKFGEVMRTDPLALSEYKLAQEKAKQAELAVSAEPVTDEYIKTMVDNRLKQMGYSPVTRAAASGAYGSLRGLGAGQNYAIEKAGALMPNVDLEDWKSIISEFRGTARQLNEAAANMNAATQTRAVAAAGAAHIE